MPVPHSKTSQPTLPDQSPVVLLLIDLISDFTFEDADAIFDEYAKIVPNIAALKARAKKAGIPVVYINDNFGKWHSDFRELVEHCLQDSVRSSPYIRMIEPDADDYTVLKPKHSAFYSTTLDVLLAYLKAKVLILTGITGNICVLFTANDAYMRDYQLVIPKDCIASISEKDNKYALEQMKKVLNASTQLSSGIRFQSLG